MVRVDRPLPSMCRLYRTSRVFSVEVSCDDRTVQTVGYVVIDVADATLARRIPERCVALSISDATLSHCSRGTPGLLDDNGLTDLTRPYMYRLWVASGSR